MVDDGGNTGIGAAQNPASLFNGAQSGQVQMLARGGRCAEPAVIADIHKNIGALCDTLLGQPGKHAFIAYEHAKGKPTVSQWFRAFSGRIGAYFLKQGREKVPVQPGGNVFAKGDKVHLVVAALRRAVGADEKRPIVDVSL